MFQSQLLHNMVARTALLTSTSPQRIPQFTPLKFTQHRYMSKKKAPEPKDPTKQPYTPVSPLKWILPPKDRPVQLISSLVVSACGTYAMVNYAIAHPEILAYYPIPDFLRAKK